MTAFYAHTPSPGADGQWDDLTGHLRKVAEEAERLAAAFGAGPTAYVLGLWHDLGKFTPEFQRYLAAAAEKRPYESAPHAPLGALFAFSLLEAAGGTWEEIVLPIAGHHGRLANPSLLEQDLLQSREKEEGRLTALARQVQINNLLPRVQLPPRSRAGTSLELFVRMLLSVLRDADWLVSERHFKPILAEERGHLPNIADLLARFGAGRAKEIEGAKGSRPVQRVQEQVYTACVAAAAHPPGIFKLTAPTGTGKTLSGLAFALRHAREHDMRRVVVALPYTSIIDQTVAVYRRVLGEETVLEHHSQVEVLPDEKVTTADIRAGLAIENWDAPLIVTTTVQLFESLLHNRVSRVRKIHNLARSVLILDEVQTLPPGLLTVITDVLKTLVEEYGVTLVLSTATQPALEGVRGLRDLGGTEIVPGYRQLFEQMRRVRYEHLGSPVTWAGLCDRMGPDPATMVVLNTRRDALRLLAELKARGAENLFHLSTLLCGTHRREILAEIARRLDAGLPVTLVATQVVETGVSIDFPAVYRAIGPLDRIVQAAGRCNRAGRQHEGRVVIFDPAEGAVPRGHYKAGLEKARTLLQQQPVEALHDPAIYEEYFRRLYSDFPTDAKEIQPWRQHLNYPKVAELFRMIDEDTIPVVVPWRDAKSRLREWLQDPSRRAWQRLQPYLVSLRDGDVRRFEGVFIDRVSEGLYEWTGPYDESLGLKEVIRDPADLIVIPPEKLIV